MTVRKSKLNPEKLDQDERRELIRRETLVRSAMQSLLLSSKSTEITVVRMINLLILFIQEPSLIFVYRRESRVVSSHDADTSDEFRYIEYFDFEQAKVGRSLEMRAIAEANGNGAKSELNSVHDIRDPLPLSYARHLYQIGGSDYYLRIFRLSDNDHVTRFTEVSNDATVRKMTRYENQTEQEYAAAERFSIDIERYFRLCARSFTGAWSACSSESIKAVAKRFTAKLAEKLDAINRDQSEQIQDDATDIVRLRTSEVDAATDPVGRCIANIRKQIGMLDQSYRRLGQVATVATRLTQKSSGHKGAIPEQGVGNFFVVLRTFDRTDYRAAAKDEFRKYAYNVRYALPDTQVRDFAVWLSANKNQLLSADDRERYGAWIKHTPNNEDPGSENGEDQYVIDLVKKLHDEFWQRVGDKQDDESQEDFVLRIERTIRDIFDPQLGNESVTFVEPIFSGGLIHIRHPFRRLGGLARIGGVAKAIDEGRPAVFNNLSKDDQRDALRTVAMFYLTRAMATVTGEKRDRLRTKIVLVPLYVGGMIFAVMGTTVLEPHPDNVMERTRDYKSRLSKEVTRLWDTIWHLQKDVLQSLERDIRRYVRDLQVAQMQPKLQAAIIEQAYLHSQHGSVFEAVFEDRLEEFNEHAREVARFASYPLVCARLAQANDKQAYENAVKLSFCGFNIALRHQENIYFDDVRGRTGRSLDAARRYGIDDLNYVKWRLEAHLLSSLPDTVLANEPSKTAATHH